MNKIKLYQKVIVILFFILTAVAWSQPSTLYIDNVGGNNRLQSNFLSTDATTGVTSDNVVLGVWELISAGNGNVFIQNNANGKRLQCISSVTGTGASVKITDNSSNGGWVQWKLTQVGSNWFIDNVALNARLSINGSVVQTSPISDTGVNAQWKFTDFSSLNYFYLSNFTPTETTEIPNTSNLTFTFSKTVNIATSNDIDVFINKVPANNSVTWSLINATTLRLSRGTNWNAGDLITVLFNSSMKSASGGTYIGDSHEYEFIVDTDEDYGYERIRIDTLVLRNNGTHVVPMLLDLPTDRSKKVPIQFHVHGGGWNGGTATESKVNGVVNSTYLVKHLGIATISIAYRCLGSNGTFTQAMEDIDAAYQWAVANADEYNLDISNTFFTGSSAGTPLSALAVQRYPNVKAYIGYYGIYNFVENQGPWGRGNNYGQLDPSAAANSAIYNIRQDPPVTLLLHGEADATIRYTQSTLFADAIVAAGGQAKAVIYPDEPHTFTVPTMSQYEDCLWEAARFLKSNGITQTDNWFENNLYKLDNIKSNLRLKSNSANTDVISTSVADNGWKGSWKLVDAGNGYAYIQNQANGMRLQGTSAATGVETSVKLVPGTYGGSWVQWELKPVGSNWIITNRAHNTRLSVNGAGEIIVHPIYFSGDAVQWKFKDLSLSKGLGEKALSETVTEAPEILIYPNSINSGEEFNLHYTSEANNNILQIRIIDVSGKIITNREEKLNVGINKLKIESTGLSQGLYFVQFSSKGIRNTKRIVIK